MIEANYSDFLNPNKLKFYTPSFTVKVIGELHALHPYLTIVFAGNRKLANEWTLRFFSAIKAHKEDTPHEKIAEVLERYGLPPEAKGGIYYEIRRNLIEDFPSEFTTSMIKEKFPYAPQSIIIKILRDFKEEGIIINHRHGRKSYWQRIDK